MNNPLQNLIAVFFSLFFYVSCDSISDRNCKNILGSWEIVEISSEDTTKIKNSYLGISLLNINSIGTTLTIEENKNINVISQDKKTTIGILSMDCNFLNLSDGSLKVILVDSTYLKLKTLEENFSIKLKRK
jgi:hypothetical protein